ncbi:hypothetical protein ACJ72_01733 [Emergomyces africanus]|uniref:Uncharacterized protein n=1 Tax=Emergomyces africanus TaxID=1955775 RepID=A0A1B7P4D5_9EURO|nr:hypothetical protein ACJ72_01733 [Emergomyces africanus]
MPPANDGQREPAPWGNGPSYLYILIPFSVLIFIAFITRFNKSRFAASGNINQNAHTRNSSEKPINSYSADESSTAECTNGTPMLDHQAQQLELKAYISIDQASKMHSDAKTATRSASLPDVHVQPWHQLSNHRHILPALALPSPCLPDLPAPHQLPPPAPHWQPEETTCLGEDITSTHPHPFGSPVMQKQPVDFPQVQKEAVQFFPRAGPDKRQAWKRRILECN